MGHVVARRPFELLDDVGPELAIGWQNGLWKLALC